MVSCNCNAPRSPFAAKASDTEAISRVARVDHLQARISIGDIGEVSQHRDALGIPNYVDAVRSKVIVWIATDDDMIGRITHINDLQAGKVIRHEGVVTYDFDILSKTSRPHGPFALQERLDADLRSIGCGEARGEADGEQERPRMKTNRRVFHDSGNKMTDFLS